MGSIFERIYARYGWRRLLLAAVILTWAFSLAVAVIEIVGVALYFDMEADDRLVLVFVGVGATLLAMCIGPVLLLPDLASAVAYLNGQRKGTDALTEWQRVASLPARWLGRTTPAALIANLGITVPAAVILADLKPSSVWIIAPSVIIAVLFVWGVATIGLELATRPVLKDLFRDLPPGSVPSDRGWKVRSRVLLPMPIAVVVAAELGGIVALGLEGAEAQLAGTLLGGIAIATVAAVLLRFSVTEAVLRPITDMTEGVQRVEAGDYSEPVPITTADELAELAAAFNRMQQGLRERESLRSAFGSYVDPTLTERLLVDGRSTFDGQKTWASIFFLDVRGFTRMTESISAEHAVKMLSELWELVVPIVLDCGGHANKFLGDGLLAAFGTPEPIADHADRAVEAAIAVQQQVKSEFDGEVNVGIGINTGEIIAGSVGGGGKLEFTLIGDPVNVAARVEELTKETGDSILATEATIGSLRRHLRDLDPRGVVPIRGRSRGAAVFAVPVPTGRAAHGLL